MVKKEHIRSIVWLTCLMLFMACAYHAPEEDWEKNGRVRLVLDWQTRAFSPVMVCYFYKDGAAIPIMRRGDASGYEGTLPAGNYQVVVCNTDCENVLLETDKGYEVACGRARQVSSLKSSDVAIVQPANLYGTGCAGMEVGGHETAVREMKPASLVRKLELNIKVTGPESDIIRPRSLTGRLTGVSPGVYLASGKPLSDESATVVFEPEATQTGLYTTTLNLFSLPEKEAGGNPVGLELDIELADGREVSTSTDITGEIRDAFAENTFSVVLDLTIRYDEISGLTIAFMEWKPGNDGSGEVGPLETKQK